GLIAAIVFYVLVGRYFPTTSLFAASLSIPISGALLAYLFHKAGVKEVVGELKKTFSKLDPNDTSGIWSAANPSAVDNRVGEAAATLKERVQERTDDNIWFSRIFTALAPFVLVSAVLLVLGVLLGGVPKFDVIAPTANGYCSLAR